MAIIIIPHSRHILNAFGLLLHSILDTITHTPLCKTAFLSEYNIYSAQMSTSIRDN